MVGSSWALVAMVTALAIAGAACGGGRESEESTLYVAGIPDQNATKLARRYEALTSYLSEELGIKVEYLPTVDYAATVTAFRQDEVQLAWFGGLTGVQARLMVPNSKAIAQRPIDAEFHSKFIVQTGLDVEDLQDLAGLTFTFGSENSTSGHLMPRHFLTEAGIDPETAFKTLPNYSGSHDKTWKLVESGAFEAGALNEAVWDAAVEEGRVDLTRVRELLTTPAYVNYSWTIRSDADDTFGPGFTTRVQQALLTMDGEQSEALELYSTDRFVETANESYNTIQHVAESLGIVE